MEEKQLTPMERFRKEKERRGIENFDIYVEQLNHPHLTYRVKAAEALGNFGDERAVKHLEQTLTPENEPEYLYVAINSLGNLGNTGSVPLLVPFLKSDDKWVRLGAVRALGMIGDDSAALPVIPLLQDKKIDVRASAVESLGRMGCIEAMDFIAPLLSDDDYTVREAARNTLSGLEKMNS